MYQSSYLPRYVGGCLKMTIDKFSCFKQPLNFTLTITLCMLCTLIHMLFFYFIISLFIFSAIYIRNITFEVITFCHNSTSLFLTKNFFLNLYCPNTKIVYTIITSFKNCFPYIYLIFFYNFNLMYIYEYSH